MARQTVRGPNNASEATVVRRVRNHGVPAAGFPPSDHVPAVAAASDSTMKLGSLPHDESLGLICDHGHGHGHG
jgi:hypothetical protein